MAADISNLVTCPHCNGKYVMDVWGGGGAAGAGGKPKLSVEEVVRNRVLSTKNNWIIADQARYRLDGRLMVDMKRLDDTGEYITKEEVERLLGELKSYSDHMRLTIWCLSQPKVVPSGTKHKWWYDDKDVLRTDFCMPYVNGRVMFDGHRWSGTLSDGMSVVFSYNYAPASGGGSELAAVLAVEKAFDELMVGRGVFGDSEIKNKPAGGVKSGVGPYDPDNPAVLGETRYSGGTGQSPNVMVSGDPHITCKVHEIPRHVQDKINEAFARGEADREQTVVSNDKLLDLAKKHPPAAEWFTGSEEKPF